MNEFHKIISLKMFLRNYSLKYKNVITVKANINSLPEVSLIQVESVHNKTYRFYICMEYIYMQDVNNNRIEHLSVRAV